MNRKADLLNKIAKNRFGILAFILMIVALVLGILYAKASYYESVYGDDNFSGANEVSVPDSESTASNNSNSFTVVALQDSDHYRGKKDARLQLIDYSDVDCQYCKEFHKLAKQLLNSYPNDVVWVYRSFPLTKVHILASEKAQALECAEKLGGSTGFWKLADALYESADDIGFPEMYDLAQSFGFDKDTFSNCVISGEMVDKVDAQLQSGLSAGVKATPFIILYDPNRHEASTIPGLVTYDNLKKTIDSLLELKP